MKAMILAAGKGTGSVQLPMLVAQAYDSPCGQTRNADIVEHLRNCGFDQIMVNTSHLAPLIEDYFGDGSAFGVEMAYSFEGCYQGPGRGTSGRFRRRHEKIQEFSGFLTKPSSFCAVMR